MAETTVVVEHNNMSVSRSNMIPVSDSPVTDPGSDTKVSLQILKKLISLLKCFINNFVVFYIFLFTFIYPGISTYY